MQQDASEKSVRRIGKYELTGELGHGGMAVVYRARDTQLLRDVAIKVLHPHLATDPESRRRFLREAQAAARLRHPNIVEVFDFSAENDRDSFMVSELLEGPTLRRFAEEHPGMPTEIVAAIGIVLCDALECAHSQGVIHRDVKPDNILLHQSGALLKLTDFGIAHLVDGGQMTATGQVLGSPAHMAPEQIEGRSTDPRTDLFAVGTVLYALAVGRLPFEAPHPHALLRKILEAEYPDPLRAAPLVGHRFAQIIRRCLEREAARRYADAAELRAALRAFVAEVGWDAPAIPLREYLANPEGFTATHRARLLERLPELGLQARRAGRPLDALGYFNRALAIDPGNARVLGLVRAVARRQQFRRAASAAGIVVVAAALSAGSILVAVRSAARRRSDVAQPSRQSALGQRPGPVTGRPTSSDSGAPHLATAAARVAPVPAVTSPVLPSDAGPVARQGSAAIARGGEGTRVRGGVRAAAAAPARESREVLLRFHPPGVSFAVDRGQPQPYGSGSSTQELTVGRHSIHIYPSTPTCQRETWTLDVPHGEGPLLVRHELQCSPGGGALPSAQSGTVAAP